jgi:CRISPR-associated protein Csx3
MKKIQTDALMIFNAGETENFSVVEIKLLNETLQPSDLYDLKGQDFLSLVDPKKGVILNGKMPMWLACFLTHEFHAVAWLGMNDPRLGGIVIASHSPSQQVGNVVDWHSELYIH